MDITGYLFYLVPAASLMALLFAYIFYRQMLRQDEGTPKMREIASYVRQGAMAYLKQQYKVVIIVFLILAAVIPAVFLLVQVYRADRLEKESKWRRWIGVIALVVIVVMFLFVV